MYETLPEAKAELLGWIEGRTVVDYWLEHQTLAPPPDGIVGTQQHGIGILSHEIDNLIVLREPSGQEIVVTASGREIIDYCEPQAGGGGYRVQIRSLTFDTWMAFRPSDYVL
jgi:hypothetical protein